MPVEPRAGDAAAHFAAPTRPVVLHRQRVPRPAARASIAAGVCRQQLPAGVPDDGAGGGHVRHASARQGADNGHRWQARAQPAGP